jgi:predicted glycoside hydrolase/deacetylase ChbG (UPF0249 family)
MLIVNADDWGRSATETEAALNCYKERRITSVSAMVFMEDSERAADLAKEHRLDSGLHLNFTEPFTGSDRSHNALAEHHGKTIRYLMGNKYAQLVYNPVLRRAFAYSCEAQVGEFVRLFERPPSHIDGHHHMHLCANVVLSNLIPSGMKMRRNFSFWSGEKSVLNRTYRAFVDRWLARRYRLPDYFFDLTQCIRANKFGRVTALAKASTVELMTHPVDHLESEYLMSDEFQAMLQSLKIGGYQQTTESRGQGSDSRRGDETSGVSTF